MNRLVAIVSLIFFAAPTAQLVAADSSFFKGSVLGIRGGVDTQGKIGHSELAGEFSLPWKFSLENGWTIATSVQPSIGWIRDDDHGAVIGSLGPAVRLASEGIPLSFVAGSAPTLVGRNNIGGRNIGTAFQFTTHCGLAWRLNDHLEASYRFQHMSNAGFGHTNPGINEHMVGVSWRF